MALRISGKNLDIGEALRAHARSRIDAAVEKYFSGNFVGHVTIEPEGSGYRTDCTLHLPSGITLQVDSEAQEPYASFNRAADRIEKRLRRYKGRLRGHHASNGSTAPLAADMSDDFDSVTDAEDMGHNDMGHISAGAETAEPTVHAAVIAESFTALKTLSVSGAVTELDVSNAHVVVFRHAGDDRINVIYRRSDGHIGWIDPSRERPDS